LSCRGKVEQAGRAVGARLGCDRARPPTASSSPAGRPSGQPGLRPGRCARRRNLAGSARGLMARCFFSLWTTGKRGSHGSGPRFLRGRPALGDVLADGTGSREGQGRGRRRPRSLPAPAGVAGSRNFLPKPAGQGRSRSGRGQAIRSVRSQPARRAPGGFGPGPVLRRGFGRRCRVSALSGFAGRGRDKGAAQDASANVAETPHDTPEQEEPWATH